MNKNCFGLFFVICSFLFVSSSFAAVLHWSPVASTADCVIAGYKVQYGTVSGQYPQVVDAGNVTFYDLDLFFLQIYLGAASCVQAKFS